MPWPLSQATLWDVESGKRIRSLQANDYSILSVIFLPDGRHVLTQNLNRTLSLWDVETGQQQVVFQGHASTIKCIALSADGRVALSGGTGKDCSIRVWDVASGKELRRFENHKLTVHCIALSPDGRRAVSVSSDLQSLWEVNSCQEVRRLGPVSGAYHLSEFLPDGRRILVSSTDQTVKLLDVETNQIERSFGRRGTFIHSVAISPGGRYALTTSNDRMVRLWDVVTGQEVRQFEGHTNTPFWVAFSPDGRRGLSGGDSTMRLWNLGVNEKVAVKTPAPKPEPKPKPVLVKKQPVPPAAAQGETLKAIKELFMADYARTKPAERLALAAKLMQKALATTDDPTSRYVLLSEARDLAAQAGDVATALTVIGRLAESHTIDAPEMKLKVFTQAVNGATTVAAHKTLAEGCLAAAEEALLADHFDVANRLHALAEDPVKKSLSTALLTRWQNYPTEFREAQKEFDQAKAAADTLRTKPDDPAANAVRGKYLCFRKRDWDQGLPLLARGDDAPLQALAQKDLEQPVIAAEQLEVGDGWWDHGAARTGAARAFAQLRAAFWYEQALTELSGVIKERVEKRVALAKEQNPDLKSMEAGEDVRRFIGHTDRVNSVAFSGDGKWALSGSNDRTMRLWDLQTGKELYAFTAFPAEVRAVALSADGKYACSGTANGEIRLWDLEKRTVLNTQSGATNSPINCLTFLPDNQRVLMGNSTGWMGIVQLVARGPTSYLGNSSSRGAVHAVAVAPGGRYCIVGCSSGVAQLYDVEKRKEVRSLAGHREDVLGVALSRDSRMALTASSDKTIRLWDTQSFKTLRILRGHTDKVTCLAMTSLASRAVTGSDDRTVRLWDAKLGRELRCFTGHADTVTSVVLSPDGRYALTGSADKTVRLWDLSR